ncbi:Hypothetical_protein [Hexamita inflata]|uniref:Hypothetical_protein n=1 Tax=Hexamita inflata TaxID=28002 RepID=A0AA86PQ08_9EUKA|nr:Hypothetical protein HINF_LOCUS26662 [Hexamita inflata]
MFYQYRQKWRRVWLRFVHKVKFSIQVAFLTRVSKKLVKPNQFAMSLQSSERRGTQSLFASRCVESLANLPQFIIGDTSVWMIKYVMGAIFNVSKRTLFWDYTNESSTQLRANEIGTIISVHTWSNQNYLLCRLYQITTFRFNQFLKVFHRYLRRLLK